MAGRRRASGIAKQYRWDLAGAPPDHADRAVAKEAKSSLISTHFADTVERNFRVRWQWYNFKVVFIAWGKTHMPSAS